MTVYNQSTVMYYPGYSQTQVHQNFLVKTIKSISNSNPMIVTTFFPHNYRTGLNVRFFIPTMFGMQELNDKNAQIIFITSDTLTINLDSINFSVFSYPNPLPSAYTKPSIVPNASGPYLPPQPLPYGNQDSFEGTIYNNGTFGNPVNGG